MLLAAYPGAAGEIPFESRAMAVSLRSTEVLVPLAWLIVVAAPARAVLPENLALRATATATSEHNQHYLARFAIDGKIPKAQSTVADLAAAWCVLKARSGDKACFTLTWKEPVEAAEIVYWRPSADGHAGRPPRPRCLSSLPIKQQEPRKEGAAAWLDLHRPPIQAQGSAVSDSWQRCEVARRATWKGP